MIRSVLAVVAGVLVLGVTVVALQALGARIHPLPPGLDPTDPTQREAFDAYLAELPALGWVIGFLSELVGTLAGASVGARIASSRARWIAGAVVALGLAGSVANWTSFPHPAWFMVGQLLGYPLVLWIVLRTVAGQPGRA